MREQLINRLEELKAEYQKGQERLTTLEQEATNLKTSLLRISGAIQVLKEELEKVEPKGNKLSNDADSIKKAKSS